MPYIYLDHKHHDTRLYEVGIRAYCTSVKHVNTDVWMVHIILVDDLKFLWLFVVCVQSSEHTKCKLKFHFELVPRQSWRSLWTLVCILQCISPHAYHIQIGWISWNFIFKSDGITLGIFGDCIPLQSIENWRKMFAAYFGVTRKPHVCLSIFRLVKQFSHKAHYRCLYALNMTFPATKFACLLAKLASQLSRPRRLSVTDMRCCLVSDQI